MKKKILSVAAAAAALCTIGMAVNAAEGETALVVLGDSIATGYGLEGYTSGDNTSAADSFANRLAPAFSSYTNLAVDGRTSAELLAALSEEETVSALENADTVVISIGGNDLLQPMISAAQMSVMSDPDFMQKVMKGEVTEEEMTERMADIDIESIMKTAVDSIDMSVTGDNINNIFGSINEINPDCDIYVLTVYDPYEGLGEEGADMEEIAAPVLEELNSVILESAAAYDNVTAVDIQAAFKGHGGEYTNILEGDIHPNKNGHAVIFDMLTDTVDFKEDTLNSAEAGTEANATVSAEPVNTAENSEAPSYIPPSDGNGGSPRSGNRSAAAYIAVMGIGAAAAVLSGKNK